METLTDNRMRTTPEIRHLFTKQGGNLAEPNSVAWMFEKRGWFVVPAAAADEDRLLELVLEAGADDLVQNGGQFEVTCAPERFQAVQRALEQASVAPSESSLVLHPKNTVELDARKAEQCMRLLEALDEHDDVQNVWANLAVSDAAVGSGAG